MVKTECGGERKKVKEAEKDGHSVKEKIVERINGIVIKTEKEKKKAKERENDTKR